jgi:hypothetical protein
MSDINIILVFASSGDNVFFLAAGCCFFKAYWYVGSPTASLDWVVNRRQGRGARIYKDTIVIRCTSMYYVRRNGSWTVMHGATGTIRARRQGSVPVLERLAV